MQGAAVDAIGVILDVSPLSNIMTRTGQSRDRRNITIVDENAVSIQITLWGN